MRRALFVLNKTNDVLVDAIHADIKVILSGSDATKSKILDTLSEQITQSKYGDDVLLFISGKCDNFKNQILTFDNKGISAQDLENIIYRNKNIVMTIIIDCFNLSNLLKLPYKYLTPTKYIETSSFNIDKKISFLSSYSLQHGELSEALIHCKDTRKTLSDIIQFISEEYSLKDIIYATTTVNNHNEIALFS